MNQEAERLSALLDGTAPAQANGGDEAMLALAGDIEGALSGWRVEPDARRRMLARYRQLAGADPGRRRRGLRLPRPGRLGAVLGGTALVAAAAAIGLTVAHQRRSGAAA